MDTNLEQARIDALAFLKHHRVGTVATVSANREPHASTVFYVADDDFSIYFLTLINTRKYEALSAHPQVAFTISVEDVPQTLQIEGMAVNISLDDDAAAKKEELFAVLNSNPWSYAPVTKLDPAESAIIWIRPRWIRWADYAFAPYGTDHVFKQLPVAE